MENQTESEYRRVMLYCRDLFERKTHDYGTAWRILRLPSITDQIYIKALRIRSVQEKGTQLVDEPLHLEFVGIINYSVMALLQLQFLPGDPLELTFEALAPRYDQVVTENLALLQRKNHDYGEAWRHMRVTSITDIILMKLLRTKQIEDHQGHTVASEGVAANYRDMLNYAIFALIRSDFLTEIESV